LERAAGVIGAVEGAVDAFQPYSVPSVCGVEPVVRIESDLGPAVFGRSNIFSLDMLFAFGRG
jgi:hypothetical protein